MDFTAQSDGKSVFARDASVVGYNRPRNLLEEFESKEEPIENTSVYLRIRPLQKASALPFTMKDSVTIEIKDIRTKDETTGTEFKFSHIFGPKASQTDIYSKCISSSIKDFLNGKNCAVMAYGISGAGKTHTLLGSNGEPGIVPRALYTIFNAVRHKMDHEILLQPTDFDEVLMLDEEGQDKFKKSKAALLKKSPKIKSLSSHSSIVSLDKENDSGLEVDPSHTVFLWVSFLEIYNEYVYDLLAPTTMHNKRPKLKLCENKDGFTFTKDLTILPVKSADEAYAIMKIGQKNINYSATAINVNSSRSHCVFTLTLVTSDGESANISTFKFCDLAGSERVNKSKAFGTVMKESQYINASLHVLGRCLKIIRDNQKSATKKQMVVPYRESKLTKLFHEELSGNAKLSVIVAINPDPTFYAESMETLNFAAIAKEIIIKREKPERKSVRISSQWQIPKARSTEIPLPVIEYFDDSEEDDEVYALLENKDAYIDQLRLEIENLKDELENKEQTIRTTLVKEFNSLVEQIRSEHTKRIEELALSHEKRMKAAVEAAILRTRAEYVTSETSEDESSGSEDSVVEMENVIELSP